MGWQNHVWSAPRLGLYRIWISAFICHLAAFISIRSCLYLFTTRRRHNAVSVFAPKACQKIQDIYWKLAEEDVLNGEQVLWIFSVTRAQIFLESTPTQKIYEVDQLMRQPAGLVSGVISCWRGCFPKTPLHIVHPSVVFMLCSSKSSVQLGQL